MLTNREIHEAEQREAGVFAALDDWDRAEENYHSAVQSYNRQRSYFMIALVSFAIGAALGIWIVTR